MYNFDTMKKIYWLLPFLLFNISAVSKTETAKEILDKMLLAVKTYTSASYKIESYERLKDATTLHYGASFTKILVNPLKLHLQILDKSDVGTELIYIQNQHNNKVIVNAGKWIPTLHLSPFNSLITKDQHHTIFSAGFGMVYRIMYHAKSVSKNNFDSVFIYVGDVNYKGNLCYKLQLFDKNYKKIIYKTKKGETALTIATKFLIPEYTIVEWNKKVENFTDEIDENTLLIIPSSYAKKAILYIDKGNNFPIYQEMIDEKGVFEKYEISNLTINPIFNGNDFKEKE
jgi:hypothetical protein